MRTFETPPDYHPACVLNELTWSGMRRRKKTEIIVERDQVLVIKRLNSQAAEWCDQCRKETRMVSVDEAAAVAGISERTVYRRVEDDLVHFTETTEGQLMICITSLLSSV